MSKNLDQAGKGKMERISTHQFMTLGAAVLMGGSFLPIASLVTGVGGRDGWMSVLPGFAMGIPYGLMVLSLVEQYPHTNLLQISETLFGKWIGKIIGILYILIMGYYGGLVLGDLGNMYHTSIMPLTPLWVFYLGGLLLVFYLIRSGIEVFARFSEVIFPLIVFALVLTIVFSIPHIERGALLPILSEGLKPLFWVGIKMLPYPFIYILFLAGMAAFLPTGKQALAQLEKGVWRAVFLVGILSTVIVIMQILVFEPTETIRLIHGMLTLGKSVEITQTVTGVESLFMGVWLGAMVIKTSACFFAVIWGLETVFGLKGLKWDLAVCIVFLGIALQFTRSPSLIRELGLIGNYLIFPFASVWILTLWGVSQWKKRVSV